MGAEISEEPRQGRFAQLRSDLREGFGQLQWREVLLFGVGSGVLMPLCETVSIRTVWPDLMRNTGGISAAK